MKSLRWILVGVFVLAIVIVALIAINTRPPTITPIAWTQFGPEGAIIARAITTDAQCPRITLGGATQTMQVRAAPSSEFPVLTCETTIPPNVTSASINGNVLALPKANPRRIALLGDTGCRLKGNSIQACNDPQQWPLAQVAQSIAAWQPDVIIHVGDYHLRETACPPGNAGCAGPFGTNWDTMNAEFFTPVAPLLNRAPWVLTRGNHENCNRAGEAWFRFWEPRATTTCTDYTDPYAIPLGNLTLLMLDSAIIDDTQTSADQVAKYQAQFAALAKMATGDAWLVTHKPVWAFGHDSVQNGVEKLFEANTVLQAASANNLPSGARLAIGGHIHILEILSFDGGRVPQLVVGNSATLLDEPITTQLTGRTIAGATVSASTVLSQFGFVTMEAVGNEWTLTIRDVKGAAISTCDWKQTNLACVAPR